MARNQKLNATLTIGAALQGSVRRNLDVVGRGLKQVGAEISTLTARKRELDKQRDVLERQGKSVADLDREYKQLNETLARLEDRQRRLRNVQNAVAGVGSSFTNMTGEVTRFARRATVVVGGASAAIFGLANSTATLGDDVAKTADRLGVGIEALQEFRYAGERTGIGAAAVDAAFETMNKNIGQATMGLGRSRKAFKQLGLEVDALARMSADERFEAIADALAGVENEAQRAALTAQIFGSDIGNLTRNGSAGIRGLRDDARSLGFALSETAARNAEDFKDALLDAQLGAQGLKNTIGAELMPVVTDVMRDFTGWLRENREPVREFAQRLGDGLREAVPVIGQIVSGLTSVSAKVGRGIAQVAEFVGGWDRLGAIIGTVFAGKAIASVVTFGFALGKLIWAVGALVAPAALPAVAVALKAIGAALVANPIGAAIMAIALGAGLIIANWDKIRPHLEPLFAWFNSALEFARDNVVTPFFEAIDSGVAAGIAAWERFRDALGAIVDWLGKKFQWLLDKLQPILNAGTKLREIGGSIVGGVTGFFSSDEPSAGSGGRRKQERAVGGSFAGGRPLLVGERGAELMFPDRGGFIATNRQLQGMAERVAQIRDVAFGGVQQAAQRAQQIAMDVGGITINAAPGMDPRAIAVEVRNELRRIERGALYDRAASRPGG
jgi:uncharacterized protein YoxC